MKDFKNNIDKMVSKILSEEIEKKSKQVFEQIDEELKGNQKKLDVAEPKGVLTAADFKKLRGAKKHKKEVEENLYVGFDDEDEVLGDYKGDEEEEWSINSCENIKDYKITDFVIHNYKMCEKINMKMRI